MLQQTLKKGGPKRIVPAFQNLQEQPEHFGSEGSHSGVSKEIVKEAHEEEKGATKCNGLISKKHRPVPSQSQRPGYGSFFERGLSRAEISALQPGAYYSHKGPYEFNPCLYYGRNIV